jgi:hypothetical protein
MEMKYFRKIVCNHGFGCISLPKLIFDYWTVANGFSHVEILYDEDKDMLLISPI